MFLYILSVFDHDNSNSYLNFLCLICADSEAQHIYIKPDSITVTVFQFYYFTLKLDKHVATNVKKFDS